MNQKLITDILECIRRETGLVLARESDRARIERYLERGGEVPQPNKPLPTELINLVTTNETYFERERHHFDYLMNEILPELDRRGDSSPIRILCAPCSSGEEPYSIALRIETSDKRFRRGIEIVGVDISAEVIDRAREGVFSARSVHAMDPAVLSRYFVPVEKGYRINPMSRSSLRFVEGNLFYPTLWNMIGDFDVIFSRNMMIYFDAEKNKELLLRFRQHLKGYLILAHADDHRQARELFTPIRISQGMLYKV